MNDLFDWRAHVRVHSVAEEFPLMEDAELTELANDIAANGLRLGLTFWREFPDSEGELLDGRNRLDALAKAGKLTVNNEGRLCVRVCENGQWGIRAIKHNYREGDPRKIALSLNAYRRHLKPEQKREIIAGLLKANPDQSNRAIAKQGAWSDKTVASVRTDLEGRAEIPHVATHTDSAGRVQPATKPPKPLAAMKRKQKRGWHSNRDRIKRRLIANVPPASPVRHIDPATVTIPDIKAKSIIEPWWVEISIDAAFWRIWHANSLQMRLSGYKLFKINGQWRVFHTKKSA
jgi:hypothetical protein